MVGSGAAARGNQLIFSSRVSLAVLEERVLVRGSVSPNSRSFSTAHPRAVTGGSVWLCRLPSKNSFSKSVGIRRDTLRAWVDCVRSGVCVSLSPPLGRCTQNLMISAATAACMQEELRGALANSLSLSLAGGCSPTDPTSSRRPNGTCVWWCGQPQHPCLGNSASPPSLRQHRHHHHHHRC